MDTRHDLFTLFSVQRGKGILDEGAILRRFDAGEVDVRGNLDFTGFATLETPGSVDCGHFDVSSHFHPPFLES